MASNLHQTNKEFAWKNRPNLLNAPPTSGPEAKDSKRIPSLPWLQVPTVDGSEIPRPTTWDLYINPVNTGVFQRYPTSTGEFAVRKSGEGKEPNLNVRVGVIHVGHPATWRSVDASPSLAFQRARRWRNALEEVEPPVGS